MGRTRRITLLLVSAAIGLGACGSGAPGGGGGGGGSEGGGGGGSEGGGAGRPEVRDSAGVVIVENRGGEVALGVVAEHVADLVPPDSALTAVPWGVAVDAEAGRIYLADWTGTRVAVFDGTGAYIGDLGRAGEGPGEFRRPSAVSLDGGGVLTVWDARRGILSRWSRAGEHLGEEPAPVGYWGPGFAVTGEGVVTVTSEQDPSGAEMTQRLVTLTREGVRPLHEVRIEMVEMRLGGATMPAQRVFAPWMIWTGAGGRIYVVRGPGYRIDVLEGGAPVRSVRRAVEPIRVTRAMALEGVSAGPGPYAAFMQRAGLTPEQILDVVGHEPEVSPIQSLAVDGAGRIWVARTLDGVTPSRVDVIEADGAYRGTFEAPGVPVGFLSDSLFLSLRPESSGEVRVSLQRLRPVAGPGAQGGREFRDCNACPVMVELPPGRFLMGSPDGEASSARDRTRPVWTEAAERPQVEVEIGYRFAVGKYEVTFAEWDRCMEAGGCGYRPDDRGWGRGDRPVIHVARADALEYIEWLATFTGRAYRLPSEAEWEYAARGGTSTARWWGESLGGGNTACDGCGSRWDNRSTAPAGSFPPNPFGLHDMLGNVSEWVADCWHPNHEGSPADGSARVETSPWWKDGECERPVYRGGMWSAYPWTVRAATRLYYRPGRWHDRDSQYRGFRVALTLDA